MPRVGDIVHVEAYYDLSVATLQYANSTNGEGYYSFPAGAAGINYSVNGFTWATTGPLTVGIDQVVQVRETQPPQSWGSVEWLGDTAHQNQFPNGQFPANTTLTTPVGLSSGIGVWMLFLPHFRTGTVQGSDLPSIIDISQFDLTTPGLVQGAASTGYFFNFGNPVAQVPEPGSAWLFVFGLTCVAVVKKRSGSNPETGH
jgi:hypothetical protein